MLRLAFDFIITWRETRTRPNAYTYSTTNDNGKVFEGTKEATLTGTWDIGKKILYTLTLPAGAEELTFTAQADGWTNEDPQPSPIEPNK